MRGQSSQFPDVKAVLLGNGQVGKSSLRKALEGELGEELDSTHGIDFSSLDLEGDDENSGGKLNLWDFGGQDFIIKPTSTI